jgi:hypothetical protein
LNNAESKRRTTSIIIACKFAVFQSKQMEEKFSKQIKKDKQKAEQAAPSENQNAKVKRKLCVWYAIKTNYFLLEKCKKKKYNVILCIFITAFHRFTFQLFFFIFCFCCAVSF